MSLSKYGAPQLGSNSDALKVGKLAQRVEGILGTCVNSEPRAIDPRALLVAPANRDGASPNLQHVHRGILASFLKAGYDRSRPQVGICVQYRSSEGKQKLLEYNRRFSKGNELLPPIEEDMVMYGTLAGTHFNIALRILRHGVPSPVGDLQALLESGSSLTETVMQGHRWWILPESTSHQSQVEVSLWRNQDQNENQASHEVEILRGIVSTCEEMSITRSKLTLGEIISRAQHRSPARLGDRTLTGLAKYYIKHLENNSMYLVEELQIFHSMTVNPREVQVPVIFFETLAKEPAFASMPLFRHYAVLTNYTSEKLRSGPGGVGTSQFLDCKTLETLSNKLDLLRLVETLLKNARDEYLPILERQVAPNTARLEVFSYADLLIRCLFAKAFPVEAHCKISTGRLSEEKARDLGVFWASKVAERYPDLGFPKAAGLEGLKAPEDDEGSSVVQLASLSSSAASGPPDALGLRPGDEVKVIRRFSCNLALPENPTFKRDIQVGASGVVKGFADEDHSHLLVAFEVTLPGKSEASEVITKALPRNLVHSRDYAPQRQEETIHEVLEDERKQKKIEALTPKGLAWLNAHLEEPHRTKVIVERSWDKLIDERSVLQRTWYLKGKVSVAMAALMESLPEFGPSDLVVCHRTRPKGSPSTEVWALRDFGAREILFGPVTSEVKEGFWTKNSSVFLGVPQQGPGKHPEGKMLGLDGRGRSSLGSSEVFDSAERRGNLFWVIQRTSNESEGNMVLEQVSWSANVALQFPGGKRRKQEVSWASEDLPHLPIMTNPKAIKAQTRLVLYVESPKESKVPQAAQGKK